MNRQESSNVADGKHRPLIHKLGMAEAERARGAVGGFMASIILAIASDADMIKSRSTFAVRVRRKYTLQLRVASVSPATLPRQCHIRPSPSLQCNILGR